MKLKEFFFLFLFCSLPFVTIQANETSFSARELYEKGVKALAVHDIYTAYEYFHSSIRINADYAEPIKALSDLLFQLKQYTQALESVKKAQRLDRYDLSLKTLEGRIYIGLAEFEKAKKTFQFVLEKEPNNVEAQLGMSDLEVVYGTWKKALTGYEAILQSHPQNIRAMLSMVLIYDELNDELRGEQFVKKAIRLYPDDVCVRYLAANHYRNYRKIEEAKKQVQLALQINPNDLDAAILYGYLLLDSKEFDQAIRILTPFVNEKDPNSILLFTLAYAYENAKKPQEAIRLYQQALQFRNSDEITRYALERCVIENSPFEDPKRIELANYHFDRGDLFLKRSQIINYYQSYKRGLQIKNRDLRGLKGFADYYRRQGNSAKYFSLLEEIRTIDTNDRTINDNYNIYKRIVDKNVAKKWGIDQFQIPRDEFSLSFFALDKHRSVLHYDAQSILLDYFEKLAGNFSNIHLSQEPHPVANFASAFQEANQNGSDYFFIFTINEKDRSFHLKVDIYYSKSGILLDSFSCMETGNDRIQKAFWFTANKISHSLPKMGRLLRFELDKGILNLGKLDGIENNQQLLIVRKGMFEMDSKGIGFHYNDDQVIGFFTVTAVDDYICEGDVSNRFNYELINEEDHIISVEKIKTDFSKIDFIPTDLYKELLRIN